MILPEKNRMILEQVVVPHLDEFKTPEQRKFALENPEAFNIERLVELTLARVGGLKFVDADGYDFLPDYSDSKTVSVNQKTYKAEINGVENKVGALRIVAYNPINQQLAYFFVPKKDVRRVKRDCHGVNSHKERIVFSWSKVFSDDYGFFEEFRVASFELLARAR